MVQKQTQALLADIVARHFRQSFYPWVIICTYDFIMKVCLAMKDSAQISVQVRDKYASFEVANLMVKLSLGLG